MPITQSLSDLIKDMLNDYISLTDKEKKHTHMKLIYEMIESHFHELSLNDILISSNNAPFLWWLVSAKSDFEPLFLKIWERFGQQIPLAALLTQHRGKSVLESLSTAKPEIFMAVWQRVGQQITLDTILAGKDSILWSLSAMARKYNQPEAFMAVWNQFYLQIPVEALLATPQEGACKGKSVLWYLSSLVASNKPEAFLAVWQRFGQRVPIDAILTTAQEGPDKGLSILWSVCAATLHKQFKPFVAIWARFGRQIPLSALLSAPHDGKHKGQSGLWLLCKANFNGPWWWGLLLQQNPGIITEAQLKFSRNKITLKSKFETFSLMPLVNARNHFFALLDNDSHLSEARIKTLFEAAKNATAAGYVSAFYDLGSFLKKKSQQITAIEAFKQLPVISPHFPKIASILSEEHLELALAQFDIPAQRMNYLRDCLQYALKADDHNRAVMIQRIARIYIEEKKEVSDTNWISQEWLEAMNSDTSVEWCMNRLLEIKERKLLLDKLSNITYELDTTKIKHQGSKSELKHLLASMDALESENQALKKQKIDAMSKEQVKSTEPGETLTPMFSVWPRCRNSN